MSVHEVRPLRVDVSVVLNVHDEGLLVHRTMRSARLARDAAHDAGLSTEIVVVLDHPSAETEAYFRRNAAGCTLVFVDHRNLSTARNEGVRAARGEFVAFLDGDDLFGRDWLVRGHELARLVADERVVLHSEYNVYFDRASHVFRQRSQDDPAFCEYDLFENNPWTSLCFASRSLLLSCPYAPLDLARGFGFEDWHWNCEVIARGGRHLVVPRTAHFIRMKARGSLSERTVLASATLGPTSMFELPKWKTVAPRPQEPSATLTTACRSG